MNQKECKRILEELWEPRKNIKFSDRTERDGIIANLLCSLLDDYLLTEEDLVKIRDRVRALLDEGGYWKEFYK